tara:strand:- start:574 stop:810 length:237 start_codon:yes stop_codon:yes gene_type:complete
MINFIKNISISFLLTSFVFSNTNELPVYSGDAVIALSPLKKTKRTDIIKKSYATDSDEPLKKRSHKRRRKIRRPRQGR